MAANEVDEFNETLRSLEETMKLHLAALKEKKKTEAAEKTNQLSFPAAPVSLPRSYSRLKRENTATGSNSGPSRPDKVCEDVA